MTWMISNGCPREDIRSCVSICQEGDPGLHMMLATCTVQVNPDYSSEERMVRLFRTALAPTHWRPL